MLETARRGKPRSKWRKAAATPAMVAWEEKKAPEAGGPAAGAWEA